MSITPQENFTPSSPEPLNEPSIDSQNLSESLWIENEALSSAFHRGPHRRRGYQLTGWLLASVITDLLIIFACTCLFLMGASLIFKVVNHTEMRQFVNSFLNQSALKQTVIFLFSYISIIYFIFLRVFLGSTIGEWSCGIRIGQPSDRLKANYVLKIVARVFLIICTGVFVLPLLSLIFKKDIAGRMTKASLYTLK